MDTNILIAIISTAGSIVLASLSYYLTKRRQTKTEWQHQKMTHYKDLLSAISDLVTDVNKNDANKRFALATNTICLVASQNVVTALMEFHDEVKTSNKNRTSEKENLLLRQLLLVIRKDIGLSKADDENSFIFHLVGSVPK
jgi:PBP1b-binding outer membrane lipoprotein LpoB